MGVVFSTGDIAIVGVRVCARWIFERTDVACRPEWLALENGWWLAKTCKCNDNLAVDPPSDTTHCND